MRRSLTLVSLVAGLSFVCVRAGQAQVTCPQVPNQVQVSIIPTITFDGGTGRYTYRYTLSSSANSLQPIENFAIDIAPPVSDVTTPYGWAYVTTVGRPTVGWAATLPVPLAPGEVDTGQMPHGIAEIQPGTSLGGFSFQSPNPPGQVNSYVLGFADVPTAASEAAAETLVESCPESFRGFFEMAVKGVTEGPVSFLPVQIDIKPGGTPNAINPRSNGVIPVAVLGTSTFPVVFVNQSSVRFGPAGAAPQNGGQSEDVNDDGIMDLVFHFRTQDAAIVCGDTEETVTGTLTNGVSFRGSDAIVTVGCKKP